MPRRSLFAALIAALTVALASGCGVKGPLVPAPKATAPTPPPPSEAVPTERKP